MARLSLLLLLGGVGLFLRIWQINASLWYDEAFSAWLAGLPFENLLAATMSDVHPPGYYLILWWLVNNVDASVVTLRLPSYLAGCLLIPLVYDICRAARLGERATWLAVGLTTLAPFQIYYSQEVRFYALQTYLVAASLLCVLERRWWLLWLCSLAALYLHNLSGVFVGSVFVAGLWLYRSNPKPLLWVGLAVALGFLPGLAVAIRQAAQVGGGYWVLPLTAGRVAVTLNDLIFYSPMTPYTVSGFVSALGVVLILADLRRLLVENEEHRVFVLAFGLPVLTIAALSLVWQPVWISRVLAPIAPAYYILLAIVAARSRRRLVVFGSALGLVLAFSIGSILTGAAGRQPAQPSDMLFFPEYQAGDGLYHASVGSYVITHYYRPDLDQALYPQDNDIDQTLTTPTKRAMQMNQVEFSAVACQHDRWWLITYHNPTTSQAEIEYVDQLLATYPNKQKAVLRNDRMADSRLYLVEPNCSGIDPG